MTDPQPTDPSPAQRSTPRALTEQYQRAFALCSQPGSDLGTARAQLLACVQGDPHNLIFVETFLQVLQRVKPERGRWQGFWDRVAFERACRTENWQQVIQRGLRLLVVRPSDGPLLCGLGLATEKLEHPDVALRYWSAAEAAHPTDPAIQRRCASAFNRMGLFEQAGRCWQRVAQLMPHDPVAREMRERFPEAPTALGRTADAAGGHVHPNGAMDDERELVAKSERLYQRGEFSAAITCLRRALQARPGDLQIAEKLEDLELEAAQNRVQMARQRADITPDDALVADLQADLARREIDVFAARSARYPQEHHWKLQLAHSLQAAGNFAEACRTLNAIPPGSLSETEVHVLWGECLQYQRQFAEALDHYEAAAATVLASQQLEPTEHLALYRAGLLALQMGVLAKARTYLQQLIQADPSYKDAQQHLDKIDSIRDKDGFSQDSNAP